MSKKPILNTTNPVGEICKTIHNMSHRHNIWDVWCDFLQLSATSIANAVDKRQDVWRQREDDYLRTAGKYTADELDTFAQLFALTTEALNEPADVLGQAYMQLELGNKWAGQFFTPDSVCKLMAEMLYGDDMTDKANRRGFVTVMEPACGGGAMLIGMAAAMQKRGVNYQQAMHVTAVDIDIKAVQMCYIQLSLLGMPAVVIHGNPLTMQEWSHWYTPFHILHGWNYRLNNQTCPEPAIVIHPGKVFAPDDQIQLF